MTLTDNKADDLREQVQLWRNHYARSFPEVFDTERMKLVQKGILEILDATLALIDTDRKKLAERDKRILEFAEVGQKSLSEYYLETGRISASVAFEKIIAELSQNPSEGAKE